jgi:hypothetical protein
MPIRASVALQYILLNILFDHSGNPAFFLTCNLILGMHY